MSICKMKFKIGLIFVIQLLLIFPSASSATDLDIVGNISYQTIGGDSVNIEVEQIRNNEFGGTSGTIHIRLYATETNDILTSGYLIADLNLSSYYTDLGRLPGSSSYYNISETTQFDSPPAGAYYIHMYISEYPDINTVLDYRTFSGTSIFTEPVDLNNSPTTAYVLSLSSDVTMTLSNSTDIDYFRVDIIAAGKLILNASSAADIDNIKYTIYDNTNNYIQAVESFDGQALETIHLDPGTHYIKVESPLGDTGYYFVSTRFSKDITTSSSSGGGQSFIFTSILLMMLLARYFVSNRNTLCIWLSGKSFVVRTSK